MVPERVMSMILLAIEGRKTTGTGVNIQTPLYRLAAIAEELVSVVAFLVVISMTIMIIRLVVAAF